jgi:DNA-binding SARP family transcriptional activator
VEIDLLGRFSVRRDGREITLGEFGGRLARQLVRILATHHDRVVTRDALIRALWGDSPPADPDANLNALVSRARRALGHGALIETVPGGYLLRGAHVVLDVEEFESAVSRARHAFNVGDLAAASAAVEAALAHWPGDPLPEDAYDEWAQPLRDRLHRLHQDALETGAPAALAGGDARRSAELARDAVLAEPLREAAYLLLIQALAASGDHAAALTAYDTLRRTLAEELGIDPSHEAAALQQRLLRGEVRARRFTSAALAEDSPFVGRELELDALSQLGTSARVALVAGRSGSGKSRLLQELCARSERLVLAARAVLPERDAPWSLARALLEAAVDSGVEPHRLLPPRTVAALADVVPGLQAVATVFDAQSWRALVLHGTARVLQATNQAWLVVDDLQWADSSSLDLLALLAARGDGPALLLAYRPEEVEDAAPVARLLANLEPTRPIRVRLGRLDADAIARLVVPRPVAETLAEQTDGTPFAVLEALRDLEQAGAVRRNGSGVRESLVADPVAQARRAARLGQQRAIWVRVQRRPAECQELLGLLALLGRPAPAALLASASSTAVSDVLSRMDDLARAELVTHDPRGFAVAHDLVGETVSERLDPVQRATLHELLTRAIAEADGAADELAWHHSRAGNAPAAAAAYLTASRDRLDRFADREAERLATEGLALEPRPPQRAALLEIRAETRARCGDLATSREDLRAALALAGSGITKSRLLARLAALSSGAEDLLHARNLADLALLEAGEDPAARGRALHIAALVDMNLDQPARAQRRFAEALSLFSTVGDAGGVADIQDAQAMARFMDGDLDGAIEAFDRVARLFADSGNLLRVVTPRTARGHALVFAGQPVAGLVETGEALELTRSLGYAEGEAGVLFVRSDALTACGRLEEALAAADAALSTARLIGHRGWTATALCGRGTALHAAGDPAGAEAAFRESLDLSAHLPLFACWAHSRLSLVLLTQGRMDEAAEQVDEALRTGPPVGQYEARVARCELAFARGVPGAAALIDEAIDLATTGGHRACLPRLHVLRFAASGHPSASGPTVPG